MLAMSKDWKGITETNTHNFCLENKLTTKNKGGRGGYYQKYQEFHQISVFF